MPQGGEHTFLEFFNHGTFSTHMRPVLGNDVVPTTANRGVRGCRWAKAFTYASRGRLLCVVQPHVLHSLGGVLSNKLWNFVSDFHSASPDHDLAPPPLQALRTRVAITSANSTGIIAYVLSQEGKLHATRSGRMRSTASPFVGNLEGMALHLTCGQTVSRMRYPSSPDEVWNCMRKLASRERR